MGKVIFALALCVAGTLTATAIAEERRAPEKVSFYFAAHQDDWQLFMNPSAFQDVANPKARTVFIHMTAGDAGTGTTSQGRRFPLYLARENGADAAIRFMADADGAPVAKQQRMMDFNGHRIERTAYRGTVSYFLRLPDGGVDGQGYAETGRQSLQRLKSGAVDALVTIDKSATYRGWRDLVATLRAIVDFERGAAPDVQLNVPEIDPNINPGDHPDHQMAARAALDAAQGLGCARRVYYVDYASGALPANLTEQQRDMESAVFAVTVAGVLAYDHAVRWSHYDRSFVGRNYFRIEDRGAACRKPTVEMTAAVKHTPQH